MNLCLLCISMSSVGNLHLLSEKTLFFPSFRMKILCCPL